MDWITFPYLTLSLFHSLSKSHPTTQNPHRSISNPLSTHNLDFESCWFKLERVYLVDFGIWSSRTWSSLSLSFQSLRYKFLTSFMCLWVDLMPKSCLGLLLWCLVFILQIQKSCTKSLGCYWYRHFGPKSSTWTELKIQYFPNGTTIFLLPVEIPTGTISSLLPVPPADFWKKIHVSYSKIMVHSIGLYYVSVWFWGHYCTFDMGYVDDLKWKIYRLSKGELVTHYGWLMTKMIHTSPQIRNRCVAMWYLELRISLWINYGHI